MGRKKGRMMKKNMDFFVEEIEGMKKFICKNDEGSPYFHKIPNLII